MTKGKLTRDKILQKGMEFASSYGLLNVSIGAIAKTAQMSRSGVIAHFSDKEDMQITILQYTEEMFVEKVIKKSYTQLPLENLHNLKHNWLGWVNHLDFENTSSCPFIKAVFEYKDRDECSIKAFMKDQQQRLLNYLATLIERCVISGDFIQNTDVQMFAYEFYSLYIGHSVLSLLEAKDLAEQRFLAIANQLINRHLSEK
ncbi:MAG: TetR/AcrR family transcriptional regulator [Oceanospirillaceae bacterium]